MTRRAVLAMVAVLGAAPGCGGRTEVAVPVPPAPLDPARLRHASLLARGREPSADEWTRWTSGRVDPGAIADELVSDPFLSEVAAPSILFRNSLMRRTRQVVLGQYQLTAVEVAGETVYTLAGKCGRAGAVSIAPWWDLANPIKVCADAVRADVWETTIDDRVVACSSGAASPTLAPRSRCGCGPNLLRCSLPERDPVISDAAMEEVRATTAHVVSTDLPLMRLWTMNETWRTREGEIAYQRAIAESRRIADVAALVHTVDDWPDAGKLAPREELGPGHHAGILSAPHFIYQTFDPRQRMRIIYGSLWCSPESAPGASPEDLLSLQGHNLSIVNDGWQELARRPICTKCHARLDYGMQFFHGFASPEWDAWQYQSPARIERGPLYSADIDDERGTAPLTPAGFASIATRQPEFVRCMASDVADYVFGPRTPAGVIDRLVATTDPAHVRFRPLMRAALVELIRCESCGTPAVPPRAAAAGALAALLDEHCTACHADGASIPSFEGAVDPTTRLRILDQVLFGRMPPDGALAPAIRDQFLAAVMPSHDDHGGRAKAVAFLRASADPAPALPLIAARQYALSSAGESVALTGLNAIETALSGRDNIFTPNHVALTAIESFRSCRGSPAEKRQCASRALDVIWGLTRR